VSDEATTPFDPGSHIRLLKSRGGGPAGEYLDVKWRIVWLRDLHPEASIETQLIDHDLGEAAVFKAVVRIPRRDDEPTVSTGYGMETMGDFRDYLEKAETKAIGRALAHAGFGTQFIDAINEPLADSPVVRSGVTGDGAAIARTPSSPGERDDATPEQLTAIRRLWQEAYNGQDIGPRLAADFQIASSDALTMRQAATLIGALSKEGKRERAAR
jgi:hypothetical protein